MAKAAAYPTIPNAGAMSEFIGAFEVPSKVTDHVYRCRFSHCWNGVATRHSDTMDCKFLADGKGVVLGLAHPGYGFERHMGYSVPEHFRALQTLGPTIHHRRSFAPVAAKLGLVVGLARIAVLRGRRSLRPRPGEWRRLALFGVVGVAWVQLFYFLAINRLAIGIALLIEYLGPLLVAIWARTVGHELVRRRVWVALGMSLVGLVLMVQLWSGGAVDGLGVTFALVLEKFGSRLSPSLRSSIGSAGHGALVKETGCGWACAPTGAKASRVT